MTISKNSPWESGDQFSILVIDDEEIVREVTQGALERDGFAVTLAGDGNEGVRLFEAQPENFALVLLDLTMPEMSGEQTLLELHRLHSDLPVILVSGYEDATAVNRLLERGASAILYKPYAPEELIKRVGAALER